MLLLSAFGYDAYGLEISSNALEAAKNNEKEMDGKGVYETREGLKRGRVTWLAGDFFKDEFLKDVEGEGTFDLIYDYTVSLLKLDEAVVLTLPVLICPPSCGETRVVETLCGTACP